MNISWRVVAGGAFAALSVLAAASAEAQVRYAPYPDAYYPFVLPDETVGGGYAFQVVPYAPGPAVRVVRTCTYPDGWNVTDFTRDINGIPNGLDHICPDDLGPRARRRY